MILKILILLICIIAIGYYKGKADKLAHLENYFTFNWKNKWKILNVQPRNGYKGDMTLLYFHPINPSKKDNWWYFRLYKPRYVEKYPFSSTALIFLTDKWHYYNFIQYRFTHLAIVLFIPINVWYKLLLLIVLAIIQGIVFEISYKKK